MRHSSYDKLDEDGVIAPVMFKNLKKHPSFSSDFPLTFSYFSRFNSLILPLSLPHSQGTRVSGEDIIIGKTAPLPTDESGTPLSRFVKKDQSTGIRHSESGVVDQVSPPFLSPLNFLLRSPSNLESHIWSL